LYIFLTRLLPGWIILATLLAILREAIDVSIGLPIGIWLAWVAKDVVLYPQIRALELSRPMTGREGLIGKKAVARGLLDPSGYVFLRGELWQAVVIPEDRPIAAGSPVRIQDVRGLTLVVEREPGSRT
jgi:membrane-bound serine protease (ClpP class)